MQKIPFQDYPNTTTPLSASNMNDLQDNVETSINNLGSDMQDYVANYYEGKNTYSSTEKAVGKWTNDEIIYSQTFDWQPASAISSYDLSSIGIDTMVDIRYKMAIGAYEFFGNFNQYVSEGTPENVTLRYRPNNQKLYIHAPGTLPSSMTITIYYTKSSGEG